MSSQISILNGVPQFDDVTQYSFKWNRTLMNQIGIDGRDVVELLKDDWTRRSFDEHAPNAELFIFYDHGSEDGLIAQGGQGYAVDSKNVEKLRGAEVYTMCCSAAERLGKDGYRKGVKAWWGYTKPFSFIIEEEAIYERLANMGLHRRLGSNCTWQTAVQDVKDAYDVEIEKAQKESKNPWVVITLINNKNCLVCWDDENPPTTTCPFRQVGIYLFGLAGHKFTRRMAVGWVIGLVSYGVLLHDFCAHLFDLGGYKAVLSLHGGYAGFVGMMVANYILMKENLKTLRRR